MSLDVNSIIKTLPIVAFEYDQNAKQLIFDGEPADILPIGKTKQTDVADFCKMIDDGEKLLDSFFQNSSWNNKRILTIFKEPCDPKLAKVCSIALQQLPITEGKCHGYIQNLSMFFNSKYLLQDINKLINSLPNIRKITHDINNKFQIITGFGSVIEDETKDPEIKDCIENIMSALDDAIDLNKQLRMRFPSKALPNIFKGSQKITSVSNTATSSKEIPSEKKDTSNESAKILVIDDEPMVQRFLCEMIKRLKHTADGVKDAESAIASVKKMNYDLAILDMNLPDMDSSVLFTKIKETCPNIKVVLISGEEMNDSFQTLLDKGANGFIQKPTSVKKLSEIINNVLAGK